VTTVATDGVTLAADGRTTAGNEIVSDTMNKLHRLPDGSVVAEAGACTTALLAIEELSYSIQEERHPKNLKGDFTLLRLYADGRCEVYWNELVGIVVPTPYAIGSGGEFARGAMAMGASATEAVRVATKLDSKSGGRARSLTPKESK
jgi:ATP-dependent protease HslVU (ClpYQ) peptidase subunit